MPSKTSGTIIKTDLAAAIREAVPELTAHDTKDLVDLVLDSMAERLEEGEDVLITGQVEEGAPGQEPRHGGADSRLGPEGSRVEAQLGPAGVDERGGLTSCIEARTLYAFGPAAATSRPSSASSDWRSSRVSSCSGVTARRSSRMSVNVLPGLAACCMAACFTSAKAQ